METEKHQYSEEKLDYLREIMNIGSGNAAGALSQLLNCNVEVKLPDIFILPVDKVSSIFKDPSLPILCVNMKMVGDVQGAIFFVVPDEQKKNLLKLLKKAMPPEMKKTYSVDASAMEEVGNIIAGVFLTAIHDFTKLNMYHTVPVMSIDKVQSLLNESVASIGSDVKDVLIIENEFSIEEGNVRTVLFIIPVIASIQTFFDSIKSAGRALGME